MKVKKVKRLLLMCIFICSFSLFISCSSKNDKNNAGNNNSGVNSTKNSSVSEQNETTNNEETTDNETTNTTNSNNNIDDDKDNAKDNENSNPVPTNLDTKKLPIYTINNDTLEKEDYIALVPEDSEITAKFIVEEVVKVFKDNGLSIGIHSVTEKDDVIIVDFESDKAPFVNIGSGVEATILDCIAQSLVDNLEGHNKIVYRKDGKEYESGHVVLGLDEVYLND